VYMTVTSSIKTCLMILRLSLQDGDKDTTLVTKRSPLKHPRTASLECSLKKLIPTPTHLALSMFHALTPHSPTLRAGFRVLGIPTILMSTDTDTITSCSLLKRNTRWKNGAPAMSGKLARLSLLEKVSGAVNTDFYLISKPA
jgi:hypothetical protein